MNVKIAFLSLFLGYISTGCSHLPQSYEHYEPSYSLRWLGTAGWKVDYQGRTILIDPYLSRESLKNSKGEDDFEQPWKSDINSIEFALKSAKIDHVDEIFITHSHFDHFADVPYLTMKFPLATVYGTATTCNILASANPLARCVDVSNRREIGASGMSVRIIHSLHTLIGPEKKLPFPGTIDSPPKMPLKVSRYVEGGSLMFYFQGQGIDFLFQGSANFRESELTGLHPTIMTAATVLYENVKDYQKKLIGTLKPKKVFLNHFDNFYLPYSKGIVPLNQKELDKFIADLKASHPSIEIRVPTFFEEIQ